MYKFMPRALIQIDINIKKCVSSTTFALIQKNLIVHKCVNHRFYQHLGMIRPCMMRLISMLLKGLPGPSSVIIRFFGG